MARFFNRYPEFYRTGRGHHPNRINARHQVLIEPHRALIAGARVLDIASHTGRWSFAALEAGARHVLGVEPRAELVATADETLRGYGAQASTYRFIVGDIHEEIRKLESIDVVFLFGFFYHTIHHALLLSEIRRLRARTLIIDTEIDADVEAPMIRLREDDSTSILSAVSDRGAEGTALVGLPSRAAVDQLLRSYGFTAHWLDWHAAGITDWAGLEDYQARRRVSLLATAA
jgi:hypothetical protein